ncbi:MAG: hypothetical protein AB1757_08635 [Acidobacteriota bacterium]
MEIIKTNCPACTVALEFPSDFEHVICSVCGASYRVRKYKDTLSLAIIGKTDEAMLLPNDASNLNAIEASLAELNEDIEKVTEEIEVLRANEKVAPLQLGCSLFGTFGILLLVFAAFVTLGKSYFGGWIFWIAVGAVLVISVLRMRRKLMNRDKLEYYKSERARMGIVLEQLQSEKNRIERLKAEFDSRESENS